MADKKQSAEEMALETFRLWNAHASPGPAVGALFEAYATQERAELQKDLDLMTRLYERRGKALNMPCAHCGKEPVKIIATAIERGE